MTYDSSEHERELRELKNRLNNINKKFKLFINIFTNDKYEIFFTDWLKKRKPIVQR